MFLILTESRSGGLHPREVVGGFDILGRNYSKRRLDKHCMFYTTKCISLLIFFVNSFYICCLADCSYRFLKTNMCVFDFCTIILKFAYFGKYILFLGNIFRLTSPIILCHYSNVNFYTDRNLFI